MAAPAGKVPILQGAGAALQFLVREWRAILPVSLVAALIMSGLNVVAARAAGQLLVGVPAQVLSITISAFAFAYFIRVAFGTTGTQRLVTDGARVWAALSIIGFFLLIVTIVAGIPGSLLFATALQGYEQEITASQGDALATMSILMRAFAENPAPFLFLIVVFGAIWMMLTSRLYLAAPATIADSKVRTFETWPLTKDNMLRIIAVRLLLLLPTWFVVSLIQGGAIGAMGVAMGNPSVMAALAQQEPVRFFAVALANVLPQLLIYLPLEAGLSAFLYKGLKPAG